MKRCIVSCLLTMFCLLGYAQEDAYLVKLCDDLKQIRLNHASTKILNQIVMEWSADKQPKITLMDEINGNPDSEYRGKGAHKFRINQVVTYVYGNQNVSMRSKGDYFNSTETDILYSAIEKSIKRGKTVSYIVKDHEGTQEFFFVAYNPKSVFTVMVNGHVATQKGEGIQYFKLEKVKKQDAIRISITFNEKNGYDYESFVIINHNPQK